MKTEVKTEVDANVALIAKSATLKSYEFSKEEEAAFLQAFVSLVPRGTYLSGYMEGAVDDLTRTMQVDLFGSIVARTASLRELEREQDELTKAKQAKVAELSVQVRDMERKLASAKNDIEVIQGTARSLLRYL